MFSGIVEEIGEVVSVQRNGTNIQLGVKCSFIDQLKIDQSISHNGVCLTIVSLLDDHYTVDIISESIDRSCLGSLKVGDGINLERSLKLNDRLDGHIVQGHVDQTALLINVKDENGSWIFNFELSNKEDLKFLIQKGSVSVNGVSLTISLLTNNGFEVSVIPYTFQHTNFKSLVLGNQVNIEFDILGKYVQRMLAI